MCSFRCFALRVLLLGSMLLSACLAAASERLTLPENESGFDNPIPPMPKPLREKHGESSATKKSVEKVQKEEEPLKKEQPSEEVPKKVDKHQASEPEHKPDISKEVIPETSPHEAPSASQSAEKESAQNGVSQGEKMTGTQVIVAREKNVPVESRTGWYWFFAALGVLLLTFFWLA